MGSAVAVGGVEVRFRATGIDAVQSGLRLVKGEAAGVASGFNAGASAAEGMSHSGIRALGELARGLGRVSQEGMTSAMGMREIAGSVMTLGASFGPGIGLAGIVITLGAVIGEVFMKARGELAATQTEFNTRLVEMAKAANLAGLAGQHGTVTELKSGIAPMRELGRAGFPKLSDVQYIQQSGGIDALKAEQARLQRVVSANSSVYRQGSKDADRLREVTKALAEAQTEYNNALKITASVTKTVVAQTATDIRTAADRKAQEAQKAADNKNKAAEDALIEKQGLVFDARKAFAAQDFQRDVVSKVPGVQSSEDFTAANAMAAFKIVGKGPQIAKIPSSVMDGIVKEFADQVQSPLQKVLQAGMESTISSSISAGIAAGFQSRSIAAGFEAGGKGLLAGVGGIIEQEGEVWLKYGILKTALGKALTLNPLASGPAAIANGAALIALGASISNIWSGGGSSGGSGAYSMPSPLVSSGFINGSSPATRAASVTPQQPVTQNITIIGSDPAAWRQVQEQLDRNAKLSGA